MPFRNFIQTCRGYLSFYGWRMVLVGCLFRFLGGGFHFYGFTLFVSPLEKDLRITRRATNLIFGLARAEGAVEGPLAGYLIDRFGPRPIMMIAVLFTGLGYVICSWVESYWALLAIYLGVVSLAFGVLFATTVTLILVPVLYILMASARDALYRLFNRPRKRVLPPALEEAG